MSSAYAKQKLKQARQALGQKDYASAAEAASSILESEPSNYNANVFLGLALLNLSKFDESEAAYLKATLDQPQQLLAWQGLQNFYESRKNWQNLRDVLYKLMHLYNETDDVSKLAETFQRLLALEREEGGRKRVIDTLSLLLPDSKYYHLLSSLEVPDQTAPEKTTTFDIQMAIHVKSLDTLLEIVQLSEKYEADLIQKEADKRRMRLDGANKGKEALISQVRLEVYTVSKLPVLYEQVLAHPKAEDELRVEVEAKLLRHRVGLLTSYPSKSLARGTAPNGTAAVDRKAQQAQELADAKQESLKQQLRDDILKLASGTVIIGNPDELAWQIDLEWRPLPSLVDLQLEKIRTFITLFPRSGRTKAFRAYLLWVQDEQYLHQIKQEEKRSDTEIVQPRTHDEMLNLAIDGLEECPDSVLAHRIAASFYLLDKDFQSASEVASSALHVVSSIEGESAVDLEQSRIGISKTLLSALTHLHPPQNHAKASRLIETALASDPRDINVLLAKAYIEQCAYRWSSARDHFSQVRKIVASSNTSDYAYRTTRLLSLAPDPDQEASIELAWCDVHLNNLTQAKMQMESILNRIDPISYEGATSELRAKLWYRLGRCLWLMGGEYQTNPEHAFTAFITSLKRNPAYAPAYTSLGFFYEDVQSPPDLIRASKCFQKAFELDAREDEAARRLAVGFAEDQEWDLVEVVARRTIEGEGGADAISGGAAVNASKRHLSRNAWAWKAIGNVEIAKKRFEEAILAFQIALRAEPGDSISWQRLGQAYALAGRHVAALKCFSKCLELVESNAEGEDDGWQAKYSIGDVHLELGNFATAIDTFEEILVKHSNELGVRVALSNAFLLSSRQEVATGFVERAEISAISAIREAAFALMEHDKHLRSAWKIVADAIFHLSKFGSLQCGANLLAPDGSGELSSLLSLAEQLETDAKLPSISVVTHQRLGLNSELELTPFRMLQLSTYIYKLRVVLNASDDKVAGSAWSDLATSLYCLSRSILLPSSQPSLTAPDSTTLTEYAEAQSAQARLQAIGSIKEALRHEPGQESYWLLLGNLTFNSSVKFAQHCFIRAIENAPKSPVGWSNLGLLYLDHNDVELANEAFIKAQTVDPDYGAAWVGQALIAKHYGDHRASRVLFEHAVSLTEASEEEADYGLGLAVYEAFKSEKKEKVTEGMLNNAAFAMGAYLGNSRGDVDALHLSGLLCERLGQMKLAIERIGEATRLLEERYETTEDAMVARQYAFAESNLRRIKLAMGDVDGSTGALEAAIGLMDGEETADADGDGEKVDEKADSLLLREAKIQTLLSLALSSHFVGQDDEALAIIQQAISNVNPRSAAQLDLTLHLAKLLWAIDGESGMEAVKEQLFGNIEGGEGCSAHVPSILALAVLALASEDADLLDAATSELETYLHTSNDTTHLDQVIRVLVAIKLVTNPESGGGKEALELIHNTIQTTISKRDKDMRSLFALHLTYLKNAIHFLESPQTQENTVVEGDEQQSSCSSSQIIAYISLTYDLFTSYSPIFSEIEKQRPQLEWLLANLSQKFPDQLKSSVKHPAHVLDTLALLDAPWSVVSQQSYVGPNQPGR
ncbi:related to antiviral protein SKI3 [Melanopsichium pennsylvanicum]|uniref:Related to antiviral protein SKI3 n=2 Tax=Melanopsichium pennsylvanicum TaxID=63383 RepID=A0AAJ5C2R4_9BASI|nr:related to SKI3-protein involved in exosome mediated 3` to 5` mRNA degradation [Melanopsichium pennsylvanicum 4]SNX81782.1 related to antiviral protein SKI3 [Melanopsichium pennsylvanicum]